MIGIPMRSSRRLQGPPPNAAVAIAVELGIGSFTFARRTAPSRQGDVVVSVIDNDGKVRVNEKATLDLTLMPNTYPARRRAASASRRRSTCAGPISAPLIRRGERRHRRQRGVRHRRARFSTSSRSR